MSEPVLSPKGPRYIRNPNCPSGMVDSHTGACVPPKQQPVAKAPAPVAPVQKDVNPPAFNPAIIGIQPDQQTAAFQTCPNGDCSKDYIAGSNRDAQMAINAGGPVNMGQLYALAMIEGAVAPYMKNAQAMNQAMQTNEAMSNPDVVRNIGEYRKQGIAAPMAVALAMQDHNTAYGYNAQAVRNFAEQDKIAQDINSKNLAMAASAGMPWTGVQTSIGGQGYASDYGGIQSFNRDGERAALGLTSGNTLRVNGTGPLLGVLGATNAGLPAVVNKMETAAANALAVEQKNKELEGQISLAKWQKQQADFEAARAKAATQTAQTAAADGGRYMMQCAALRSQDSAESLKARIAFTAGLSSSLQVVNGAGGAVYKVMVGPFNGKAAADAANRKLQGSGISGCIPKKG